jgi:hypothetical protein
MGEIGATNSGRQQDTGVDDCSGDGLCMLDLMGRGKPTAFTAEALAKLCWIEISRDK